MNGLPWQASIPIFGIRATGPIKNIAPGAGEHNAYRSRFWAARVGIWLTPRRANRNAVGNCNAYVVDSCGLVRSWS
jgi:hypothetical protein